MPASSRARACSLVIFLASSFPARAQQYPRIGYVFPAGGRQGTTLLVTVGGQFLGSWKGEYHIDVLKAHFSGDGITAEVVVVGSFDELDALGAAGVSGAGAVTPLRQRTGRPLIPPGHAECGKLCPDASVRCRHSNRPPPRRVAASGPRQRRLGAHA
mgnify:CR=1 FL=1